MLQENSKIPFTSYVGSVLVVVSRVLSIFKANIMLKYLGETIGLFYIVLESEQSK